MVGEPAALKRVYIKHETLVWAPAAVVEKKNGEALVRLEGSSTVEEERTVKLKDYRGFELPQINTTIVPDLLDLQFLHEAAILYNLKARHASGMPYTRSGDLVVAVNPFFWIPELYSNEMRKLYAQELVWTANESDARNSPNGRLQDQPHIYEVSALAYSGLAFGEQLDQSILITGESGSGKTETTKLLMHHIASIQQGPEPTQRASSTIVARNRNHQNKPEFCSTVQRILDANPLLEAFGNAATCRNDNSSRFGKYTQLQFDTGDTSLTKFRCSQKAHCVLAGSVSQVYLLESSRVCLHAPNERTFHIFYQLLASSDERKQLVWKGLVGKTAMDFKYIGPSKELGNDSDDATQFLQVTQALERVGLREKSVRMLLRAICIVLQLGNIVFTDNETTSDDRAAVQSTEEFAALSDLMGIAQEDLLLAFSERVMSTTRGETFKVPLSASSAKEACDAFSKEIYSKTFLWLVRTINHRTSAEKNYKLKAGHGDFGVIGLLDIFGFESFETNRFGQLCINYANEKLQQKAIHDIFRASKEEYDREGIPLNVVEFEDNEQVLKIMEGRIGLIALLNEECYRPKGNDSAFVSKVLENFKDSRFVVPPKRGRQLDFGVVHYAGTVIYTAERFVESNQDTLPVALKACAKKSGNEIIAKHLDNESSVGFDKPEQQRELTTAAAATQPEAGCAFSFKAKLPANSRANGKAPQNKPGFGRDQGVGGKRKPPFSIASGPSGKPSGQSRQNSADDKSTLFKSCSFEAQTSPKETATAQFLTKRAQSSDDIGGPNGAPKRSASNDLMGDTIFSGYQTDLCELMDMLSSTHSRYLRCIKPNANKAPKHMDHKSAVEQFRSAGIVATVKLSRAMYPNSLLNVRVRDRYNPLWNKKAYPSRAKRVTKSHARAKLDCEALLYCALEPMIVNSDDGENAIRPYAVGKTKSYFKKGALEYLESKLVSQLGNIVAVIQSQVRGGLARQRFEATRSAAKAIEEWWHVMMLKHKKPNSLAENAAEPLISTESALSTDDSTKQSLLQSGKQRDSLLSREHAVEMVSRNSQTQRRANLQDDSIETLASVESRKVKDMQALQKTIEANEARVRQLESETAMMRRELGDKEQELENLRRFLKVRRVFA